MENLAKRGEILIAKGDRFPSLRSLPSTTGRRVDLVAEATTHHIVLFFYPGDREGLRYPELMGCTPEACAFRDYLHALHSLGAVVYGVSLQATARQKRFAQREALNFELLSDEGQELVRDLGIPVWISPAGEHFAARTTIVIERGGRIGSVFDDVRVDGHAEEVLEVVKAFG